MTTLVQTKQTPKAELNKTQKTFNRLRNKIKSLHNEIKECNEYFDRLQEFYLNDVKPIEKSLVDVVSDVIESIYAHYSTPKLFKKKEQKNLKEFLQMKLHVVNSLVDGNNLRPEIHKIYEEIEGVTESNKEAELVEHLKAEMTEMFNGLGVDLDISNIDANDSEDELRRKISEAMNAARENFEEIEDQKPKTASQKKKELKEKELAIFQKRGLGTIYKQLAKNLHPDLEQDPARKLEKEKVMKRLTTAYESNDLYEILTIEMECAFFIENGDRQDKRFAEEQLKIYNAIFKEQIEELEMQLEKVIMNPKYQPIHGFALNVIDYPFFHARLANLKKDVANNKRFLSLLQSPNVVSSLKEIANAFNCR